LFNNKDILNNRSKKVSKKRIGTKNKFEIGIDDSRELKRKVKKLSDISFVAMDILIIEAILVSISPLFFNNTILTTTIQSILLIVSVIIALIISHCSYRYAAKLDNFCMRLNLVPDEYKELALKMEKDRHKAVEWALECHESHVAGDCPLCSIEL
jgi:uncharacterized membrane protein